MIRVVKSRNLAGTCKICGCKIECWKDLCSEHYQKPQSKVRSRVKKRKLRTCGYGDYPSHKTSYKDKPQRQKWWADLTEQQKDEYLTEKQELKHQKNITKAIGLMEQKNLKFDCLQCFHHKTHSCTDNLPNGCQSFYDPQAKVG